MKQKKICPLTWTIKSSRDLFGFGLSKLGIRYRKMVLRKLVLSIGFCMLIHSTTIQAQCWDYAFEGQKWSVNLEGNAGSVLTDTWGNGWELGYGGSIEWAPFNKFFYFHVGGKYIQHILHDNSPNPYIFPNTPTETYMDSRFFRVQYGIRLRLDWWFKKVDYQGIHPAIGHFYFSDSFIRDHTQLSYSGQTISTNEQFSNNWFNGKAYELGFTWVISDYIKWDLYAYVYYSQGNYSIFNNGIGYNTSEKAGLGISTGFFLRLGS